MNNPSEDLRKQLLAEIYPRLGGQWTQEQEDEALNQIIDVFLKNLPEERDPNQWGYYEHNIGYKKALDDIRTNYEGAKQ
jgi:hypothetical protein